MSEVQARFQTSSRGRGGSGRGGRGGYASRGGNSRRPNGDKFAATDSAFTAEDDGDISELRKKFGSDKVETIKELFPDWSDADILYALQETDGDIEVAATRISEGSCHLLAKSYQSATSLIAIVFRVANLSLPSRIHFPVGRGF